MTLAQYDVGQIDQNRTPLSSALLAFMKDFTIDSKETGGNTRLRLYRSQRILHDQICAGIKRGKHHFTVLKGRQLGISTYTLALDIFWLSMFPGTQGALVVDEESNRDQFKATLTRYMEKVPARFRVGIRTHNRNQLVLKNGSMLYYLIAGTKKKGSFGHGKGLSFVHATELSRYGDPEAWASFVSALAEENPRRLFIYESTARGPNLFSDIWEDACESVDKVAVFLGWWTKESYRIARDSERYKQVMVGDYSEQEKEKIDAVKQLYGVEITDEQVAWYRSKTRDLNSTEDDGYVEQEFPWTAEEAFQLTGKLFFPSRHLTLMTKSLLSPEKNRSAGFRFHFGEHFHTTEIERVSSIRETELRVWEPPSAYGRYSLGADPAYGSAVEGNQWRDQFVVQVLRCYADRVTQVAEYCTQDIDPHKFAWVVAYLGGWYRRTWLVLELNGPGSAVLMELKHIRRELQSGHIATDARAAGVSGALTEMVNYLYQRPDSLSGNYLNQFKATGDSKSLLLRRLKDALMLNTMEVRSMALIKEMATIVDDKGSIGGSGRKKDDRVLGAALAYRGYDDWLRATLSNEGHTWAKISALENQQLGSSATFQSLILQNHFKLADLGRIRAGKPDAGQWKFDIREKTQGIQ